MSRAEERSEGRELLEQTIEIQTAKAKAQIRKAEADGIAKAMDTINQQLTPLYVQ